MNSVYMHILTPVLAASLMNGLIFSQKWNITTYRNPYIPGGGIVGIVWLVLFALLGYVHFKLYMQNNKKFSNACITLILFFLYSLAYPVLTAFSGNPLVFTALNLGAFFFALVIAAQVFDENSDLIPFVIPLIAWTSYVNVVTLL